MSKGYEIPLSMPGADEALKKLEELERKLGETATAAARAKSTARGGASSDPWSRLDAANTRYERMRSMGLSDSDLRVSRLEQVRAQRAADRANRDLNPQAADPMRTMFMRTRLKIGPWHPLVGDLVKNGLLDESKIDSMMSKISGSKLAQAATARLAGAALPMLAIGAGVTVAGVAAYKTLEGFSDSQRSLSNAYYIGGGGRNLGAAVGLGNFMGMSPEQTAQMANQLGDKLRSGGYASAQLRQMGVVDFGRYTINKFDNLIRVMDSLRKVDEKRAIMISRDLGMPELATVRDINPFLYEGLKRSVGFADSPGMRRAEADYRAGKTIASNAWDTGVRITGAGVSRAFTDPTRWNPGGFVNGLVKDMIDMLRPEGKESATKELTSAIKDLGRTIKDGPEMIGGGRRTKSVISAGTKALNYNDAAVAQAMGLGAFTVG